MPLPSFVSFPSTSVRKEIPPEEWILCLESWILLAQENLLLPPQDFSIKLTNYRSLADFLVSYVKETSLSSDALGSNLSKAKSMKRQSFLLIHRIFTEADHVPSPLLTWTFLGDASTVFSKSPSLRALLDSLWGRESLDSNPEMQKGKNSLITMFEGLRTDLSPDIQISLRRIVSLLKASFNYGQFLMIGSDFTDSLNTAHAQTSTDCRRKIVTIAYFALLSLMDEEKPKSSALLDHLYSLKTATEKQQRSGPHVKSLLSDLVSTTPFIRKLDSRLTGPEAARAKTLIMYLAGLRASSGERQKIPVRRKIDKGKSKDCDKYGHGAFGSVHVHKLSLVTQIQDLFPDLGSGFIVRLLDEYDDDTEQVTAHLLDDSLPAHLKQADRAEETNHMNTHQQTNDIADLAPHSTPPLLPTRRNIFDNDAFDRLAISPTQLHQGRRNPSHTADTILSDRSTAPNKAAILSALAAFDSDDDERDDTYDISDVGGTIDSAIPGGTDELDADQRDSKNEETLFAAYSLSPEVFNRDAATRRAKARAALKSETGMTDEAIEGWAIMIGRDPRRLRRLEAKFSTFSGAQRELAPTAYRDGPAESGTEDSDGAGRGGRGGFMGRGRGRGRGGGRGASVAGPADEKGTQVVRQRKDVNKGSRANHNRRDQRARKIARGGFGV